MVSVQIDPEFAALVPALSADEYSQLEQNLLAEGCRDPLVVWQGVLLDGHHRYDICSRHGLPYKVVERPCASRAEAKIWMIRNQLGRRNLTAYTRSLLVLQLKQMLAEAGRARMSAGGKGLPNLGNPVRTDQTLAGMAGVSHGTLHKVETIEKRAPEAIKSKARQGEMSVHQAYVLTQMEERGAKGAPDVKLVATGSSTEWYTPGKYVDAVHALMGGIDVDPASNSVANQVVRARVFYDVDNDGLQQPWPGRVFLNPPYRTERGASGQSVWSARLLEQYEGGVTTEAVLLVDAATDCKWFQPLWDHVICFTDHRIRFYGPEGDYSQSSHGNAFVYLGQQVARFAELFSAFGVIARRLR